MRWLAELSDDAAQQLARFPRNVRDRIERAIDEFEGKDDSQWSNIKALQGPEWKGGCVSASDHIESFSERPPPAASWRSLPSS